MKHATVLMTAILSACCAACSCSRTPSKLKAAESGHVKLPTEGPTQEVGSRRGALPPDLFVDLLTGNVTSHVAEMTPLTLQFRVVSAGPAELNGLHFNVPRDLYISKYELSQYQMWFICSKLFAIEETFEEWTVERMMKAAPPRMLKENELEKMKAYFLHPEMPAMCVTIGEIHRIGFIIKQQFGLDCWVPSVAEWIRMASAEIGMEENVKAIMDARSIKWVGWDRKGDRLRYLLPVTSLPPNGMDIGGFVDVFGGAGEVVCVTREESLELKRVIDILAQQYHRPRSTYKGLRVSEHGFLVMGGSFQELGVGANSDQQAIESFVKETTEWDLLLGQQLNGTALKWNHHVKWPTGLRLVLQADDAIELIDGGGSRPAPVGTN